MVGIVAQVLRENGANIAGVSNKDKCLGTLSINGTVSVNVTLIKCPDGGQKAVGTADADRGV